MWSLKERQAERAKQRGEDIERLSAKPSAEALERAKQAAEAAAAGNGGGTNAPAGSPKGWGTN